VKAKVRMMVPVLARKPMARATRVTLFEREVRERLSGPAIELLLGRAKVLAEGKRADSPTAGRAFFGSIMLTVELASVGAEVREAADAMTAERVGTLMAGDARVLKRVQKIAEREASRLAGAPIRAHLSDVRVRWQGASVFIDVDVEGK
jgi:hypothetical protein